MADDRLRIGAAQRHPGGAQHHRFGIEGRMDVGIAQPGQLGPPVTDIGRGIELGGLRHRRDHPVEGRGVDTRPHYPLPAERIGSQIGINKAVPEPALALPPIDQQMLDQKGGSDHPDAIVHPASRP